MGCLPYSVYHRGADSGPGSSGRGGRISAFRFATLVIEETDGHAR
jgi:hypothetical protein